MTHGFGDIANKLTGGPTYYMQRFRAVLLHIVSFCSKAADFRGRLA
ncbi:hypothetical protein NK6_303 [Bradyrhizobium diazoefficiens]|uniref:Uncharacterized protein n=1 Tax=Bradyrhizobium diazoefficiens TaxID=1355477 RepID=A0A0E4FS04_9BRAD|nr:hypothetical protein NK6_303 [Bradyrhizobium diazoefficiens]